MNLNVGIVGLGYWGPNYARIITQLEDVNLSWCCDVNNVALSKFSKLYPSVKTTNRVEDLLNDRQLNCVIIVTPAQDHFKVAKKFLQKDKAVLVEKPLTDNPKKAKILVNISKKRNKILMVDHTFIFNSAVKKLKQLIDNKELGKVYYIYGNYNALGPIRRDVSSMWDLPHFIYVVNFLLGTNPVWVQAVGKDYLQKETEDVVFLTFEYPGDILFNLNCSWIDPVKVRRLVVVGERKMLVFDDIEPEDKLKIYDKSVDVSDDPNFANLQLVIRHGDTLIPKLELEEPLKEVTKQFIEAVRSKKNSISNGDDGLNLVRILNYAQVSLSKQGKRIKIRF